MGQTPGTASSIPGSRCWLSGAECWFRATTLKACERLFLLYIIFCFTIARTAPSVVGVRLHFRARSTRIFQQSVRTLSEGHHAQESRNSVSRVVEGAACSPRAALCPAQRSYHFGAVNS